MKLNQSSIALLKEAIPNIRMDDVFNLISNIQRKSSQHQKKISNLDQWTPNPNTVLEVLKSGITIDSFEYCLSDFKEFSKSKQWTVKDNLSSKFIVHVKLMISNGKIITIERD